MLIATNELASSASEVNDADAEDGLEHGRRRHDAARLRDRANKTLKRLPAIPLK
jgi:hypothetical protein